MNVKHIWLVCEKQAAAALGMSGAALRQGARRNWRIRKLRSDWPAYELAGYVVHGPRSGVRYSVEAIDQFDQWLTDKAGGDFQGKFGGHWDERQECWISYEAETIEQWIARRDVARRIAAGERRAFDLDSGRICRDLFAAERKQRRAALIEWRSLRVRAAKLGCAEVVTSIDKDIDALKRSVMCRDEKGRYAFAWSKNKHAIAFDALKRFSIEQVVRVLEEIEVAKIGSATDRAWRVWNRPHARGSSGSGTGAG